MMKIYLVGGAVRDELLGLPIKERDYLVTGSSEKEMLEHGFTQVGKGFPVFLHPQTHEEYALARQERKVAPGHTGFSFSFSPQTTIEEDLVRRDITINAIAKSQEGELIDPFNGQKDIKDKCIRHVSDAFAEDPLRVLRVCRFKAKFPDFTIAPKTLQLMRTMAAQQEFHDLSKHRLWQELYKCLLYPNPRLFFQTLVEIDVMPATLLCKINEPCQYASCALTQFSLLLHTPALLEWIKQFFSPPNEYIFLAQKVHEHFSTYKNLENANGEEVLKLFQSLKALSNDKWLTLFLETQKILTQKDHSHILRQILAAIKPISQKDFPTQKPGPELGDKIHKKRIAIIYQFLGHH